LAAVIVFSEIASERGWSLYVSILFHAVAWGVLGIAFRDNPREITRGQLAGFGIAVVALIGGLGLPASTLTGAMAIAAAFVVTFGVFAFLRFFGTPSQSLRR
jgi:hypothetical protein